MTAATDPAVRSLYVHIPYCERKCEYCDFVSVAGARGQREYVTALVGELQALGAALDCPELDTVFVGGGTPGLLDLRLMAEVMDAVGGAFRITGDAEVTLEVNPSSCSVTRARAWREAGFNRVSIGVQSTHDDVLAFLGRVHDSGRALAALGEVRDAGFENVSADLIYAVPGLDDERWLSTLAAVCARGPDHVSCYELTVESGTPLHRMVRRGQVQVADAEVALRQHRLVVQVLGDAGLAQYEVSNFARPGRECRHNLVYWRNHTYAAAGVGAHGHLPASAAAAFDLVAPRGARAFRYRHGRDVDAYVRARAARPLGVESVEWIDEPMRAEETLMLGLRLREGVALCGDAVIAAARELADGGMLELHGAHATATARGEEVLNAVALRLATAAG